MTTKAIAAQHDFIVCGSGSADQWSPVAQPENTEVTVLLLEAGGTDDVPEVRQAAMWPANVGSE